MTDIYSDGFYQTDLRQRQLEGHYGTFAQNTPANDLVRNYVNKDPQAKQSDSLTISSGADATFTFNGVEYTVTTGSGTAAGDALLVQAYMLAEGAIYGYVDIDIASAVLTLTAKNPGVSYTIASGTRAVAASITATAVANSVAFGRAVVRAGFPTGGLLSVDDTMEAGRIADTSAFTAQVDTWVLADPGAGIVGASVDIVGFGEISVSVDYDTDLGTTIAALDAALAQALADEDADTFVTISSTATDLVGTATFAGVEFSLRAWSSDAAAHTLTSNKNALTSFAQRFAGMSKRSVQEATTTNPSSAVYPANEEMVIIERGDVWVENAEALSYIGRVFVDLTVGAGAGKFYGAPAASRVPLSLSRAEWIKSGRTTYGDNLGMLRLK